VQAQKPRIGLLEGCRSIEDFEHLNVIDEGTFGVVYRARDKQSGVVYAIKKVKLEP
jgi:cell division cycle 2-like protein